MTFIILTNGSIALSSVPFFKDGIILLIYFKLINLSLAIDDTLVDHC